MEKFGLNEDQFWRESPAAGDIFEYRRNHPGLGRVWGFDQGYVSDDRAFASADFSCVALTGWGRDRLFISAVRQNDGSWKITHTIDRAD